ncbi:HAD family phosphatase [Bacillus sp. ISL-40]|uniref:Cof-type HAD-IIB family hydrolase n=1 Tax=unclassified Bacillus (in: firmicutes) TaxID=185979 RepID=UPI001BE94856|nr:MULTISPECIES: Cof-type HAD-IIB family hydrolase [unclassified Bacillus (in: firmicutes)]MBT2698974.1 HAD family phosphatase [Bacillus sp. ISL-40]MBT2721064.1 HAD family phosphatase [Bacillus sp. ISL-46]MBT2742626.1 HAD family phosphatase [Bacillus sp. ISL-77]
MKLIALDLDGTLLSPEKHISQENIQAIRTVQSRGHFVMICSGRAPEDIKQILNKYDLTCPLAGSNGTIVEAENTLLNSISMDLGDVKFIAQRLDDEKLPYCLYTNKGIFVPIDWSNRVIQSIEDLTNHDFNRFIKKPLQSNLNYFTNYKDLLLNNRLTVNKFFILTFHIQRRKELISSLHHVSNIAVTSSSPFNVEIMHKDGHKGIGLKRMAEYYNIPMVDTVAIGDNFNDIPMLECAGLSIAMDNADIQVKKMCDTVTLSNSENGVAHALNLYVL